MRKRLENLYNNSTVSTKSPVQIMIMFYARIIANMEIIKENIKKRDITELKNNIEWTRNILTELALQASESNQRNPNEIWSNLEKIYGGCLRRLNGVQETKSIELCDKLIEHISPLKEAMEEKLKEKNE